ncbi:MAG: ketoacyl-ACP synthase III [Acidobacteria bacterium]|jgi:3-oxoacyl-[acyl-carrier-protein] synthase-3|nr:ketoacyl-ACP synthase III [Acidobacteriota bacterium]
MNEPKVKHPFPIKIAGIGVYLPERIVMSSDLEKQYGLEPGWSERKQGVKERRWVQDETVSFMAAEAAKEAVANAGLSLTDIDLIINASQVIEQAVPENGALIQRALGLGSSGIPCMSVTAACLGFLVAVDLSSSLLMVGRYRNILIINSEITSLNLDFNNPNVFTLMGDGAAAAVVTTPSAGENSGVHAVLMETYSEALHVSSIAREPIPNTLFNKNVTFQELGFDYNPQNLQTTAMKYNQKFLARLWPLSNKDAIKLVIPNQASRFVLDMMKFIFPAEKIMGIIDRFGNTSSAGYPMALAEAVKTKRIERGDLVLMTGIGAGFSLVGMVFTY